MQEFICPKSVFKGSVSSYNLLWCSSSPCIRCLISCLSALSKCGLLRDPSPVQPTATETTNALFLSLHSAYSLLLSPPLLSSLQRNAHRGDFVVSVKQHFSGSQAFKRELELVGMPIDSATETSWPANFWLVFLSRSSMVNVGTF